MSYTLAGMPPEPQIAVHLHPPVSRDPDYLIDSPAVLRWWEQEAVVGGSVLVEYETLLQIISDEPGIEAMKRELGAGEGFTMAALTQVSTTGFATSPRNSV